MTEIQPDFVDVSRLLAPRSIAVVGASDTAGNLGGAAVRFLRKFGAPCEVWPINPGRETVAGLRCYPNVAALPSPADLAILAVPAASVEAVVRECVAVGITAGIVWAGGFAEGGEAGRALQDALVATCRETGFALLGPNCLGIIDPHTPMIASFASFMLWTDRLLPGNISMVSQSGGLATMTQALAQREGCGFRYMISTGNEAVLTIGDFVRALVDDDRTKVIAIYIEGSRDGAKFRRALLAAAAAKKPVVVLKAGATPASAGAAAAHTGALVGEARVWDAVLRDCAAIAVTSHEELLDVSMQLSGADLGKLPHGGGVAVITFGGGSGVLSADQADRIGLAVPPLAQATRAALAGIVPPLASVRNPVDLTPQAYSSAAWLPHLPRVLDTIADDPQIGTVLFQLGPMARDDDMMAGIVVDFRRRSSKAVLAAWPLITQAALAPLRAGAVHVFPEGSRALRTIAGLIEYTDALACIPRDVPAPPIPAFDWAAQVPNAAPKTVISEHECHAILARAGLAVARGKLALSEDEAVATAREFGGRVVMKAISATVTHRAAAGLLALGVASADAVRETWRMLQARAAVQGVGLDGIYVQQHIEGGIELLVSALRDPDFGVFVSLGAGGGLTELIDDVVVVPAPLDAHQAARALRRLRILRRASRSPLALQPVVDFVTAFSRLAAAAPWRRFVLEVNPIIWSANSVTAVDGLLLIEQT
jgi:acyl-CoA synthetase (NDP forming)